MQEQTAREQPRLVPFGPPVFMLCYSGLAANSLQRPSGIRSRYVDLESSESLPSDGPRGSIASRTSISRSVHCANDEMLYFVFVLSSVGRRGRVQRELEDVSRREPVQGVRRRSHRLRASRMRSHGHVHSVRQAACRVSDLPPICLPGRPRVSRLTSDESDDVSVRDRTGCNNVVSRLSKFRRSSTSVTVFYEQLFFLAGTEC